MLVTKSGLKRQKRRTANDTTGHKNRKKGENSFHTLMTQKYLFPKVTFLIKRKMGFIIE